jgi:hypothetical protein
LHGTVRCYRLQLFSAGALFKQALDKGVAFLLPEDFDDLLAQG